MDNFNTKFSSTVVMGLIWGFMWAIFMQYTRLGWYISTKQTWLGVVIGCSGNLLIAELFLPHSTMSILWALFAGSSVPVAIRSISNQMETSDLSELWRAIREDE